MLYRTTKLREVDGCKDVYIRKNRNDEERKKHNELMTVAREWNNDRTENEKKAFFWKVVGERVRKWFIRAKEEEVGSQV